MFGITAFAQSPFAGLGSITGNASFVPVGFELTGSINSVTPVITVNVPVVSGFIFANVGLGTVTISGDANIHEFITGVQGVSVLGVIQNTAGAIVNVTNTFDTDTVTGTTAVGNAVVFGGSVQGVSSSGKTAALGDEIIIGDCNITAAQVGDVTATTALSSISLQTFNVLPMTGLSSSASLGTVIVIPECKVSVSSVSASGSLGVLNIWSLVNDEQTPNYTPVNDNQSAGYSEVNTTQNPNWTDVA
jgi:hypothetical protein|tara:strand:+ start:3148 stop:3885 length:738 start_codon:yes stop_codon:yes gene_type:complete